MKPGIHSILTIFLSLHLISGSNLKQDYSYYHNQTILAETLISDRRFSEALEIYNNLFQTYDFVFLREYKISSQLAYFLNDRVGLEQYIRKGMEAGWTLKEIKKNPFLSDLKDDVIWKSLENSYPEHHKKYLERIDQTTREITHKMFKKDQAKAFGALLRIGDGAQERYAIRKFAPHSEKQMQMLIKILDKNGYPGERLIGNNYWMSTITSHHNSITQEYVKQDTLYHFIRPKLQEEIKKGNISPYEFALIDDWHKAVISNRSAPSYGFLNSPKRISLAKTNQLRQLIGLRSVELRNKLVDIESETGMNFFLPDWVNGKIIIEN
ncbi:hypothetical protein OO013_17050 [Mangrovivirga sp. M17]|uniref:Uncharacterized protein n=1 Tax=Mangrovivirga halotolerans TaxID=2993936 RepID=A0ABT3RUZ1_9BACT|nr:hypothetical protein [Mangrovivirga halotolerans]MCX2745592.1 hypothetical protein [Mangrovivirga halotolerans]